MRFPDQCARNLLLTAALLVPAGATMFCGAQVYDPPPQAGRLSSMKGAVSFQQAGADQWMKARRNMTLGPGDRIYTDENGRAEIQIGQTYVRVGPNTDVTLESATPGDLTFALAQGSAHLHALGLWQGQAIYLNTPSGSVTLNTASQVRVDVLAEQQAAIFTDLVAPVQVTGAGGYSQGLEPGQALELAGSNPVTPQWFAPAEQDDLDNWSYKRDRQIAEAAAYQYVSPGMSGAEELDGYGSWMPGTPYGAVWYPNDVPPGWVPYRNGYWVNRAPWGWVWVEDEPWGYAPFHYGRWVNYGGRWGWVPGPRQAPPVWSPAQVAFVGGVGGPGTSAWVPLGPGEPFRPWYPCSPGYVNQVNITNIQPAPRVVVQNTYVTNVTNVTYINQTNVTVVKQQDMASGRPVTQTAIAVSPAQARRIQPLAAPMLAAPTHPIMVGEPPAQSVPVSVARPTVIDAAGKAVLAQPGARPTDAPKKAPPVMAPPAGRQVVAAPQQAAQPGARPTYAPAPRAVTPMPGRQVVAPPPAATGGQTMAPPRQTSQPVPAAIPQPTKPPALQAPAPRPAAAPAPKPAASTPAKPAPKPDDKKKTGRSN